MNCKVTLSDGNVGDCTCQLKSGGRSQGEEKRMNCSSLGSIGRSQMLLLTVRFTPLHTASVGKHVRQPLLQYIQMPGAPDGICKVSGKIRGVLSKNLVVILSD